MNRLLPILTVFVAACAAHPGDPAAGKSNPTSPAATGDRNTRFGLPAPAAADPGSREAYLISRPQYTLSYNAKNRNANWVSWQLRHEDLGKAVRGAFEPDPLLPKGVIAGIPSSDYDGSGFDRGHLCPAQDRSGRQADMDATFYTTNIVPQAPNCNQRGWERLEAYCRDLTKTGHVLQIAAGPAGVGGTGKDGRKEEIGKVARRITVPAHLWKVILVLPHDGAEPTMQTRTIATLFPNDQTVDYDWPKYRVSIHDVEKITGLHFFPDLPAETAAALKAKVDTAAVHVPHPKHAD
jgi:endonuclease G